MGHLRKPSKVEQTMAAQSILTDSNNERGSVRSSDDARSTASPALLDESGFTASPVYADERAKLIRKIEKIRERIARYSIIHEGDVEEYVKVAENPRLTQENPQLTRIKQHFERKNKKYTQEMEVLQKKLEDAEQKLDELDRGLLPESVSGNRHRMLQNVGQNIKRTGVNLKGMTGSVMSAPRDIAQKVKRNMFGSADNLPSTVESSSNVGQSTFYTKQSNARQGTEEQRTRSMTHGADNAEPSNRLSGAPGANTALRTDVIPQQPAYNERPFSRNSLSTADSEQLVRVLEESEGLRRKCGDLENANHELNTELGVLRSELSSSRFQIQKLEQTLNETMEVHQSEMKQLKNDLNLIGTRMDYQYNDRFKRIEESVESSQNHMYRIETNIKENTANMGKHTTWNALMLSGANIIVELLKMVLYFSSVILDMIKPITGTRKRAGILFFVVILLLLVWESLDVASWIGAVVSATRRTGDSLPSNSSPQSREL